MAQKIALKLLFHLKQTKNQLLASNNDQEPAVPVGPLITKRLKTLPAACFVIFHRPTGQLSKIDDFIFLFWIRQVNGSERRRGWVAANSES